MAEAKERGRGRRDRESLVSVALALTRQPELAGTSVLVYSFPNSLSSGTEQDPNNSKQPNSQVNIARFTLLFNTLHYAEALSP